MSVGFAIVTILLALVAFHGIMSAWLCLRLKQHHHALWLSLGSPTPGRGNRSEDQSRYFRFVRLGEYESLPDELTKYIAARTRLAGKVLRFYMYAGSATMLAIVLLNWHG
jgi:hypothetical protein